MRTIPFLNLKALHARHDAEIRAAIDRVLAHGQFINGPEVGEFNCAWAGYCGVPWAVGCANGTVSLHAIFEMMGIGRGDEVIVPSHTFIATAESIRMAGARPVFVEIDEPTMLVDARAVEAAITPRTRAIAAVHLYGMPCDMDALGAVAARHRLPVIEDAAQAHGALHRGLKTGALGHAGSFSFFPGKNLGAFGDAGGVTTGDEALARKVRLYVNHGRESKFGHEQMGTNYRMDTLQAAILLVKLAHLDEWNARRRELAAVYRARLAGEPFASAPVVTQAIPAGAESAYHLFVIRVPDRDKVREKLKARGIDTGMHYPTPSHLEPSMADVSPGRGALAVTERVAASIISMPMCPTMTPDDVEHVCDMLAEVLRA